jgi:hypothetical protein
MSIFLARNKEQSSQICEGDKYPTIGAVLTALSICISSMRPTTVIGLKRYSGCFFFFLFFVFFFLFQKTGISHRSSI